MLSVGNVFFIYWVCWLKEFHNTNVCYPNHGSLFLCAGLEELEDGDDDASEMSEDLEGDGDDSETSGDDSEISEDDVEEDGDED